MTRTFIGLDSTGTACVKITKNNADDPYSTPDSARHKFYYNSKDHKVAEIVGVQQSIETETGGDVVYVGGSGNVGNFTYAYRGRDFGGGAYYYYSYFTQSHFPGLDYYCPLLDYKFIDEYGYFTDLQYFGVGGGISSAGGYDLVGLVDLTRGNHFATVSGYSTAHQPYVIDPESPAPTVDAECNIGLNRDQYDDIGVPIVYVWNLPGDSTAIQQAPALSSVSGQKSIEITPTSLKVAKPGYDVSSATKAQMAFSAEKKPAKIIASGDIAIAGGTTTTYDIPFAVSGLTYVDVQFYPGGSYISYPAWASADFYGATYTVSGYTIIFNNAGSACRARFIVFGVDELSPSSGSNKVLQQFDDGGNKVVRLLAPGSADPPRMSDIVVDSRWPTVPILAEGYISITGVQTNVISFTNPGFLLFIKLSVIREYRGKLVATAPTVRRLRRDGSMGGDTVYATAETAGSSITIYAYKGNPINMYLTGDGVKIDYDPYPVVGVRYYVFGITP